jgi:cellobiose phosphorylase
VTVAGSSILDADLKAKELADKAAAKTLAAQAAQDVKILEADHALDVTVEALQASEKAKAPALTQDPDALNQALLAVGRRQRDLS